MLLGSLPLGGPAPDSFQPPLVLFQKLGFPPRWTETDPHPHSRLAVETYVQGDSASFASLASQKEWSGEAEPEAAVTELTFLPDCRRET